MEDTHGRENDEHLTPLELFEKYRSDEFTIIWNGIALRHSLDDWLGQCPSDKPLEEMDPVKLRDAINAVRAGRVPFS